MMEIILFVASSDLFCVRQMHQKYLSLLGKVHTHTHIHMATSLSNTMPPNSVVLCCAAQCQT